MKRAKSPFIQLDNDVFQKLKRGIRDNGLSKQKILINAFVLYFFCLRRKDITGEFTFTPKILLTLLNRQNKYRAELKEQLELLNDIGLIEVKGGLDVFGFNDILCVRIAQPQEKFEQISIANEGLLSDSEIRKEDRYAVLAIYCFLRTRGAKNKEVTVSMNKIAEELCVSIPTVEKALKLCQKIGVVYIQHGKFDPKAKRKTCNKYALYDYDKPCDNTKITERKAKYATVKRIIDKIDYYSPCLLIGSYAEIFKGLCPQEMMVYRDLNGREAVRQLIDDYWGIGKSYEKILVIDGVCTLNSSTQNFLLKFVEETELPLVFLMEYDNIIPPLISRMRYVYKDVNDKALNETLSFEKVHIAYSKLEDMGNKKNYMARHCPKLYFLEYLSTPRSFTDRVLDNCISELQRGKIYTEINNRR